MCIRDSSTTVHAHAGSEEGFTPARSRRGPRPRTSSVAQRGVGHGYETSMNFKRIAHKSHPRLRTSEGVRVAQDVPTKSYLRGLHKGPGQYPVVSPVKVADDATVASATSALSPMTTASQFPSDLLSFTSEIGASRSYRTGLSCLLYTSPSPRDATLARMPSSA